MADVGSLVDCLRGINEGLADLTILDKFDQLRRQKYHTVTNPLSTVNLTRLFLPGEDALLMSPGLQKIDETSRDPDAAKAFIKVST